MHSMLTQKCDTIMAWLQYEFFPPTTVYCKLRWFLKYSFYAFTNKSLKLCQCL